jgi:hypothetical protein
LPGNLNLLTHAYSSSIPRLRRHKKLKGYFDTQTALIASYEPLQQEVDEYLNNITRLQELIQGKDIVTTGITAAKNNLKKQIADEFAPLLSKTRAYALDQC